MPTQERLWLDDEKCLLPGSYHPGQKHEEDAVRLGTSRPFYLSSQDDQLLTQQGIFCDEFGFASGKVGQCQEQEWGSVGFGPGDEAVVQRPKTQVCQPRDDGEYPLHNVHSPLVQMSESMLEIIHFL